jgi:hypothetical protein
MPKQVNINGVGVVNFPDNMTPEQITKAIETDILPNAKPLASAKVPEPTALESIGRGMMDAPQGLTQGILQGVEGLGLKDANARMGEKLGIKPQGAKDYTNKIQDEIALYEQGAGDGVDVGRLAGNVATALPLSLVPGANTYAGAAATGSVLGATQPIRNGESRGKNAAMGGAFGIISKFVTDKAANAVKNQFVKKTAEAEVTNIQNATKNATLQAGQDLGYVVPPSQANPSTTNQVLEGISGKIKTGQVASIKNQSVTNNLVRNSLNLPEDAPLTVDTLKAVRDEAGKAYDFISQIPSIKKDAAYEGAIVNLKGAYKQVEKEAPELAGKYTKEFDNLITGMNKQEFSGEGANEIIKLLRYEGNNVSPTANAAEKAVGKAQIKAANALEDLIERNLSKSGSTDAVKNLREARKQIAKSYDIEKALTERGNVDAKKIAALVKKGKLTGELEQVGKFAGAFPKATQEIDSSVPATSPLDWYAAVGTSVASGNPLPMALAGTRPGLRSAILSKPYQRAMASPGKAGVGKSLSVGNSLANNKMLRDAAPSVGTLGSLLYADE